MKKTSEKFKTMGKYFFISNTFNYETYDCFVNYMFKNKRFSRKMAVPFNIKSKEISDIILENYYIRQKQDLNEKLESKLKNKNIIHKKVKI